MFFALIINMKNEHSHDFYMHKTSKNIVKKTFKSAKMNIFENSLNPSKDVQIEFWMVEKIAIECLNRMLKKWWKFIKSIFWYRKYCCQGALFACFWKSEKMDFCWYLLKERSYDLINLWKKNLWSFRILTWNIFSFE